MTEQKFYKNVDRISKWQLDGEKPVHVIVVASFIVCTFFGFILLPIGLFDPPAKGGVHKRHLEVAIGLVFLTIAIVDTIPVSFWIRAHFAKKDLQKLNKRPDLRDAYLQDTAPEKYLALLEDEKKRSRQEVIQGLLS